MVKLLPNCEDCKKPGLLYPVGGQMFCLACSLKRSGRSDKADGVPPDLRGATLSDFRTDFSDQILNGTLTKGDEYRAKTTLAKSQQIVRVIAGGGQVGSVFYGENGLGKSHLAAGIVHAVQDAGKTARWIHGEFFYSRLLDLHRNGESIEDEIFEHDEDLLIVDDLSFVSDTEFYKRIITMLVSHVIDYVGGSIIITTNLTPNAMEELVGSAVVDRVASFGLNMEFEGHSMREQINQSQVRKYGG